MKVLFFEPYAYQTPHFETCLELMQEHINAQDEVIMLGCDSTLPTCDLILNDSFRYKCSVCRSKRKNGLKLIEGNYVYSDYLLLDELEKKELKQMKFDFSDLKTLMNYKINDFDLGYGVAYSII
jgi:ABC-type ATPase with predicted acetyltransferase domain